jgi:hypothetical protein
MSRRNPEDTAAAEVQKDIENPVRFGPGPVVAAGITDPAALKYAAGAQARQQQQRKPAPGRYVTPVAGGKGPPIPRLDQPATEGASMADQAVMQRGQPGPAPMGGMFTGAPPPSPTAAPIARAGGPPVGILPSDVLPNEAKEDPEFRQGQGSMYAASQPHLAYKYGVLRNGKRVPPQQLTQVRKGLSDKSIQDLKMLSDLQGGSPPAGEDPRIEQDAAASVSGAAGRLGNSPTDGPKTEQAIGQEKLTEAVKKLDDFDFATFRDMMMKDIINNEEQRNIIEARCKQMDITDLIVRGFVTQVVPIVPGKFEVEFRSVSGEDDLAVKRLLMLESKGLEVTERYLLDKYSLMGVTCGLYAINNNKVPDHHDRDGNFNEEAFWKKFTFVTKYPLHMLGSIGVNCFWFDIRVRRLFVAEKLGNG